MDIDLLHKFYRGECSEEEAQKVINWFSSKEEKDALLHDLHTMWERSANDEGSIGKEYDSEKVFNNILGRLHAENEKVPLKTFNLNRYQSLKVAAVIALAVCASFVFVLLKNFGLSENIQPELYISKVVPAGQKRTIMLADGTKVILNAESSLTYPEHFSTSIRKVRLEGEAFFEVARDTTKPFVVETKEVLTTVLGTSFNVKAYPGEQDIVVAVASGKVKVSHAQQDCYLLAGNAAHYIGEEGKLKEVDFNMEETLAWKDGVLYFNNASFQEIKMALERWYGVRIYTSGSKELQDGWQYSGVFEKQNLSNVLQSISYVKGFSFEQQNDTVKINFSK